MAEGHPDRIDDASRRARPRSPSYPVFGLVTAIQNAVKIYEQEGSVPVPTEALLRDLGFSGPTAPALRTLATMITYGLFVEEGGEYRLTDDALAVIKLSEDDSVRQEAIARLCERPEIFQRLKKKYPEGLPSDRTVKIVLAKEWGLGDPAADSVLAAFRQTMDLAQQGYPAGDRPALTPKPAPVVALRPVVTRSLFHVWSLGEGVTVELRSNAPLGVEHFDLLEEYVKLAKRAAAATGVER
jgi:hypothetical protein